MDTISLTHMPKLYNIYILFHPRYRHNDIFRYLICEIPLNISWHMALSHGCQFLKQTLHFTNSCLPYAPKVGDLGGVWCHLISLAAERWETECSESWSIFWICFSSLLAPTKLEPLSENTTSGVLLLWLKRWNAAKNSSVSERSTPPGVWPWWPCK